MVSNLIPSGPSSSSPEPPGPPRVQVPTPTQTTSGEGNLPSSPRHHHYPVHGAPALCGVAWIDPTRQPTATWLCVDCVVQLFRLLR